MLQSGGAAESRLTARQTSEEEDGGDRSVHCKFVAMLVAGETLNGSLAKSQPLICKLSEETFTVTKGKGQLF